MKFLFGAVIPAERTLIIQIVAVGANIMIAVRSIDGFNFITWCRLSAVPAYFAAIIAIGFPLEQVIIIAPAAAIDAAPEFLSKTVRTNIHGFTIGIIGSREFCGFKTLMTAVAVRKIGIPAIAAHQMSVKFNCLVFSHVFTAMRTNEVTLARAPDAHGIPGLGRNDILIGKISPAAWAFFVCFVSAITAYLDIAPLDETHFSLYNPMTASAFTHDITTGISLPLFVCRR